MGLLFALKRIIRAARNCPGGIFPNSTKDPLWKAFYHFLEEFGSPVGLKIPQRQSLASSIVAFD
jgi:hypothetical protein